MLLNVVRVVFIVLSILGGLIFSAKLSFSLISGVVIGLSIFLLMFLVERFAKSIPSHELFIIGTGIIIGWIFTFISWNVISEFQFIKTSIKPFVFFILVVINIYFGVVFLLARKQELPWINAILKKDSVPKGTRKVLDSSVIIDGRVADIMDTGFLEGELMIPRFILQEVQRVADSQDSLKRTRGRRGLEVLNKIQQNSVKRVEIYDRDFPEIKNVDEKLVEAARVLDAKIITNDYNLNKVAKLQGVEILNINDLSNAVKPVVLPGELMTVRILKEGKEAAQGVAYLDDGTMIVVDNGKSHIGQTIEVVVTSVLQTAAGRMIFTKYEG